MGDRRKDGSGSDDEAGVTRKDMGRGEGYEASGGVHRMIAPHPQKRLELQRVAAASMAPLQRGAGGTFHGGSGAVGGSSANPVTALEQKLAKEKREKERKREAAEQERKRQEQAKIDAHLEQQRRKAEMNNLEQAEAGARVRDKAREKWGKVAADEDDFARAIRLSQIEAEREELDRLEKERTARERREREHRREAAEQERKRQEQAQIDAHLEQQRRKAETNNLRQAEADARVRERAREHWGKSSVPEGVPEKDGRHIGGGERSMRAASGGASESSSWVPDGKPKCSYGESCTRQNPQHFADESHPPSHPKVREYRISSVAAAATIDADEDDLALTTEEQALLALAEASGEHAGGWSAEAENLEEEILRNVLRSSLQEQASLVSS
jgi:hypothetical protein